MTDLELTERVAQWLGYDEPTTLQRYDGIREVNIRVDNEWFVFDPLNDKNDLWMVLEKLIDTHEIKITLGINKDWKLFELWNNKNYELAKVGFFTDLPRTVCELVAELEVKE